MGDVQALHPWGFPIKCWKVQVSIFKAVSCSMYVSYTILSQAPPDKICFKPNDRNTKIAPCSMHVSITIFSHAQQDGVFFGGVLLGPLKWIITLKRYPDNFFAGAGAGGRRTGCATRFERIFSLRVITGNSLKALSENVFFYPLLPGTKQKHPLNRIG